MTAKAAARVRTNRAFTLIELLVVMSIISLLISILIPSLSRARAQAKGVHCLARLKEFAHAIAAYENISSGSLPPAQWFPEESSLDIEDAPRRPGPGVEERDVEYGWAEILFSYVYAQEVRTPESFPVQRNVEGERWQEYFLCRAVGDEGVSSGHYRVYLPAWSGHGHTLEPGGIYGETTHADPTRAGPRDLVNPMLPLIGDANEFSERGDGRGCDDCSYIDAGEANYAGTDRAGNGNRFSDRHHGGTNYLFQDLHAGWSPRLRDDLARDYDLNGVRDIDALP